VADQQLREDLLGLSRVLSDLKEQVAENTRKNGAKNSSASHIDVHAGGAATWMIAWIASLCCAFMCGLSIFGGYMIIQNTASINANKAYLSAIYQMAPQLKPKEGEKDKPK
jgi:hypothetical protein